MLQHTFIAQKNALKTHVMDFMMFLVLLRWWNSSTGFWECMPDILWFDWMHTVHYETPHPIHKLQSVLSIQYFMQSADLFQWTSNRSYAVCVVCFNMWDRSKLRCLFKLIREAIQASKVFYNRAKPNPDNINKSPLKCCWHVWKRGNCFTLSWWRQQWAISVVMGRLYIPQVSKILEPVTFPFCSLSVWLVQGIICLIYNIFWIIQ